ncbi:hypothetical protein EV641_106181 [Rhodococcus sp. SMB37]|uniref:hypothetical protein n=1 Tax=Rhodococcus sp. SMB37 TaxID=2512213 RepID=UPI00104D72C8|nr:hypothetical protein [Rhodococcus sp. SMB37]TCN53535.1 hypothetical protein EV641_106181 [Rhodococcus sp. SMB37]
MPNATSSSKALGLRKTHTEATSHRFAGRTAMVTKIRHGTTKKWAARPPDGSPFRARSRPRPPHYPAATKQAVDAATNLLAWEKEIKNVVSSFEIATQDVEGEIGLNFAVTFNLRETGLTLQWLTKTFRNELKTVEVPALRDIVMHAAFDTANTDEVVIELLSARRRARNTLVHGVDVLHSAVAETASIACAGDQGKDATDLDQPDAVELETTTGNLTYELPISLSRDAISSMQVSEILSPQGKPNRALANNKRRSHQLLGLKVGNQYRYPLFQFDRGHKRIRPTAEYANRAMECDLDPWGTLDWWFTENAFIGGERPVDRLEQGHLTEEDVDLMVEAEQLGMD